MLKLYLSLILLLSLSGVLSAQVMTHRYSFFAEPNGSLTATDSVAAANGSIQGNAVITNGQLVLDGTSGTYLNLPSGIINSSYSAVTIETWANFGALPANCFFWGFGNTDGSGSGEDYIFCAPQTGRVAITAADPGWQGEQNASSGMDWSGQTNFHVVAVFNPSSKNISLYTNGVLAAINTNTSTLLSAVNDLYSYVGRSLYAGDPYAPFSVSEFRIWNGALSGQQVALDAASGPGQIVSSPGALQSLQLQMTNQLLAGATQQAWLSANFANVSNVNLFTYEQPAIISGNTNVITVSSSGLVTGITPFASANLIATYDGLSVTQNVAVAGFSTNQFIFNSFGDGFWTVINSGNSNVLTTSYAGTTQEQFTNNAQEQQFEILYNLQNGSFRLRQRSTWHCLGTSNNIVTSGGAVNLAIFYTAANVQAWYLESAGGNNYRIFNAASNLVLQTDNKTPANITLVPTSSSPYQLWHFTYQTHFPKKGTAGYEGQPYQAEFKTSWAYNYNDNTSTCEPASFDFVPMVDTKYWEPLSDLQSRDAGWLAQMPPAYLLGYNEPDNSGSASTNPSTNDAIAAWPSLMSLNVPLVGPAMQNEQDSWESTFYAMIAANGYRVDYSAVHLYVPPNSSSVIGDLQSEYNAYGRPVWLTEFSPVDWSGNQGWTEDDDYNFLAEFMWMAESQEWLKRYAIFPFSGSNPNPPYASVTAGYRGNFFESDGQTLTPYGELYAAWDGQTNFQTATPYIIHNLATSFRLVSTNLNSPQPADIYVRDASAQWALLGAPTTNHYYIISLKDGRRLSDTLGTITLVGPGTTGAFVEWTLTGPDAQGYYFIANPTFGQNLNASGTAPAITFATVNSSTQNNNTRWRLVEPYQPASIGVPSAPGNMSATARNQNVILAWSGTNIFYNIYRGTNSGGPYTKIASLSTNSTYSDSAVLNGLQYFYVVTGLNILTQESAYSIEASARPVSTSAPQVSFVSTNNAIQLSWPFDHTGWRLMVQTNQLNVGLGTNWFFVSGSNVTNLFYMPIDQSVGSLFFQLTYP